MSKTTHCPLSLIVEFEAMCTRHILAINPLRTSSDTTKNREYWHIRFYTSDCPLWDWQWAERLQQVREEMIQNQAEMRLRAVLTPSERAARVEICRQAISPVDPSLVDEARKQAAAWRAGRRNHANRVNHIGRCH